MAGTDHSGQGLQSGRTNRAENRTRIWAQRLDEGGADFEGPAIFIAEVSMNSEDPDIENLRPINTVDGIWGKGWSGFVGNLPRQTGGVGVVGFGGQKEGTGVFGQGGGQDGVGGVGIHAMGGSQRNPTFHGNTTPGTGILALGGRCIPDPVINPERFFHGAGVVAVAGGNGRPLPSSQDTGSVGVYAQGADAEVVRIDTGDGSQFVGGPTEPRPGVLGRGGVPLPREGRVAAGVVGLAGDTPIPSLTETGDNGVFGAGPTGVFGRSDEGAGVRGHSVKGNGGVFESETVAQVHLNPLVGRREPPPIGRAGDLAAITPPPNADGFTEAELWFCVRSSTDSQPALWRKVQFSAQSPP